MDNRYPNLKPLEQLPLSPERKAKFISACQEVCRRTGAGVCFNVVSRCLFFFLRDCSQGIAGLPWTATHVPIMDAGVNVELLVREINDAKRPMDVKLAEIERSRQEAEYQAEDAEERRLESLDREANGLLKQMGNHFGMGRHYRPSVVIDGNKAYTKRESGLLVAQGDER